MAALRIAVLGATGLVGQTILRILEERAVPVGELFPLASTGAGREVQFGGRAVKVRPVEEMDWRLVDVAFFAASAEASRLYAPRAAAAGATVIDKSSVFRMDPTVPLVVPEVNLDAVGDARIIASPNCSTIQMVLALKPVLDRWGIARILVSTYQAVSGTGREALETLDAETLAHVEGRTVAPSVYPTPIAFNVLPYCDAFGDQDYTGEEWKLTRETQKIFGRPIAVSATAVRVPVAVGHSESIYAELERECDPEDVRAALRNAPGLRVVDEPEQGLVPTPLDAAGRDEVLVGRIRKDLFEPRGLHLFVVGDNLRKGAALNAVQIMEALQSRWQ